MISKALYYIAFCFLALTPFVYSNELYNGLISAKQIWFYGAMAFLTLVTAFNLLFDRQPFALQFNTIDLTLLAFYAYYLIRAATTPYMPLLHNQRFINWTLCVILYFIIKKIIKNEGNEEIKKLRDSSHFNYFHSLISFISSFRNISFIINSLILTALAQAIWGLLQLYGFLPSFNSNFKITGTFFNPAPNAMYLAVIFPLAFGKVLFYEKTEYQIINSDFIKLPHFIFKFSNCLIFKFSYYLSFATIIAIILVLPATMIRAAWLGTLAGSLVVLQYKYHFIQQVRQFLNTRFKKALAVAASVAVIVILGAGIYHLKKDSANGKLFIWEVTLSKIAEKPFFGYGVGRFEAEYNNWQAEYFKKHPDEMEGQKGMVAGNTKYAFNEFLEMVSEAGVVGLVLFWALIAALVLSSRGKLKNESNESNSFIPSFFHSLIFLFPSLFSFLILSFLSFPMYSLPTLMLFSILLAVYQVNIRPVITNAGKLEVPKLYKYALAIFSIATVLFLTRYTCRQYTAYYYWDEADKLYASGVYAEACKSFEKVTDKMKYNGNFLQYYGKAAAMGQDYTKGAFMLRQAQLNASDEVLFTTLGDCYKALKKYKQSEAAYQYAAFMVPHKLYPHYLLAKLYEQSGNHAKAIEKAKEVLRMEAKVDNMAEEEIKQEMKKLINNI